MASSTEDLLINSTRDLYLIKYRDLDDETLRKIIYDNAKKATAMPNTPGTLSALCQLNGESKACNQILSERVEHRNQIREGKKKWNDELEEKKENIFRNLSAAASANGQLIAAILEDEDGLTQSQIAAFCEELSECSEEELKAFLEELVKEGILRKEDDRYFLLDICTPTLYPEDPVEWNMHKYRQARIFRNEDPEEDWSKVRCLLTFIRMCDDFDMLTKPYSAEELVQMMNNFRETGIYDPKNDGFTEDDMYAEVSMCDYDLQTLYSYGLVDRVVIAGNNHYYFHMLGERTGKPYVDKG